MEIIREIENYKKGEKPVFLALGNFDGVHLGHHRLLQEVVDGANANSGISTAFIFDPHPNKIINPDKAPKLITGSLQQAKLLEQIGIKLLIYNSFNKEISKWEPEEFVQKIIVDKLNAKHIFVGFNYSFGYKGQGTPDLLKELGIKYGFKVSIIRPVELDGKVVSSTLIREALEEGQVKEARHLLGHPFTVTGSVVRGEKRGSKIGFPTANLKIDEDILIPGIGVYAAKALYKEVTYNCVVNIGRKPTFHNDHPVTMEVHIIDFAQDIYDETLTIYFLDKVRDEKKFNGIDDLVNQISQDRDAAYKIAAVYSS